MTTTLYATWDDVQETYEGTIPDSARPRIEALIKRASAKLTALVPSLPGRLTSGAIDPELPSGMVIDAVLTIYRNPTGATQQGVGPFSQSFPQAKVDSRIKFDPEDIRQLLVPLQDNAGIGTFQVAIPGLPRGLEGLEEARRTTRYLPEQYRGFLR